MQYKLALSEQAEQAILDACLWYEEQRSGLGKEFLIAVKNSLISIQSNPLLYGYRKKKIRGHHMQRFPYVIFFVVDKEEIFVTSVLHTSRKPKI